MSIKILLLSIILGATTTNAFSQADKVAAGGDATGSGGKVNYSVGQVAYICATGNGGTASQGNQQTYVITDISGIDEKNIFLDLKVYPNPTQENVVLSVTENETRELRCVIHTLDGRTIYDEKVLSDKTILPFAPLAKGAYLVSVYHGSKSVKSFNIIKN